MGKIASFVILGGFAFGGLIILAFWGLMRLVNEADRIEEKTNSL